MGQARANCSAVYDDFLEFRSIFRDY
jgi:hypothetical protein